MSIVYVNGRYSEMSSGLVSINDRGFQFGDSVYEVIPLIMGRLVDEDAHIERLERSLEELSMDSPISMSGLRLLLREVLRKNRVEGRIDDNGILYFQITRGVSIRNHVFPSDGIRGGLVITWKSFGLVDFLEEDALTRQSIKVCTTRDMRWKRCDIKTTNLLPNCMAKTEGFIRGFNETWMIDDEGKITEGSSSNAWIVTRDNRVITRDADNFILNGITRRSILGVVQDFGFDLEFRGFTLEEAINAREAFATSAGLLISPVVGIDGSLIGKGDISEWRVVPKLWTSYLSDIVDLEPIN